MSRGFAGTAAGTGVGVGVSLSVRESVLVIRRAMSSCTSNMSAIRRSYVSDHTGESSLTRTSCVEIRSRSPARRTPPSSANATLSCAPISRSGTFFPLKAKADVREITRSPPILASVPMSWSVSPSLRYSSSWSPDRLVSGSTTSDSG